MEKSLGELKRFAFTQISFKANNDETHKTYKEQKNKLGSVLKEKGNILIKEVFNAIFNYIKKLL